MPWELPNPNITNSSAYLEPRLSNDEANISSNAASLAENVQQLTSQFINVKYPPSSLTSAKGDGTTDDTSALQAILNYASQYGYDVIFPIGKYKITAPLTVLENQVSGTWNRKHWPRIIGQGYSSWDSSLEGSVIIAYNIPSGRAALELLGESNGAAAQGSLENISIHADDSSNNANSFCLWVGDCWFFKAWKVKLTGQNGLKTRCGSAPTGNTTYAMIATIFEQCQIETVSNTGWAVYPESFDTGTAAGYDNLKFDSCTFRGLTAIVAFTVLFDNCMWWVNPRRNQVAYSSGVLNGFTVDFSTALWIAQGNNISIRKGYFEDYRRGILIQPVGNAAIRNTVIENCNFNAWSNYVDQSNTSTHYKADSAISILPNAVNANSGWVEVVTIRNNQLNDGGGDGTGTFQDTVIRNQAAITLNIVDNTNYTTTTVLRYVDTAAKKFHFVDPASYQAHSLKIIDFDITLAINDVLGLITGTSINNYYCNKKAWIQRITIIADRTLQSAWTNLSVKKNGTTIHSTDFTTLSDTHYTENSCSVYVWEKTMNLQHPVSYNPGDLLGIGTYIDSATLNAADNGAKIKVKVELAY